MSKAKKPKPKPHTQTSKDKYAAQLPQAKDPDPKIQCQRPRAIYKKNNDHKPSIPSHCHQTKLAERQMQRYIKW